MADQDPHANLRLRAARLMHGWSQEDLAAQLHALSAARGDPVIGVDGAMIGRWERGVRRPRPRYVRLLVDVLDASPADLGLIPENVLRAVTSPDVGPWTVLGRLARAGP